jgi:hypothetical protein
VSVLTSEFAKTLFPSVKDWFGKTYNERGLPMASGTHEIDGADIATMEGAEAVDMTAHPTFTTTTSMPGRWTAVPTGTIPTGAGTATAWWPSASMNHADALFKAMYKEMQVAVLEGADQATLVKLYSGYFSQIEAAIRMENDSKELISKLKEIEAEADAKLATLKHAAALAALSSASSVITPYSAGTYEMAAGTYTDPKGIYGTTSS